jgi:acyl-CoA thioester hydrolase
MAVLEFDVSASAHLHTFRVEHADIDEFGHANNVVWIRWINDAALSHACAVGLGPSVGLEQGFIWEVRRHDIEYLLPAFEGQTIECATWPAVVRGATSLRRTVFRCETRVLARAETTWALLNPSTGRPRRVPREMMLAYRFIAE